MGTILLQFRHGLTPFNVTAHTLKLEKHCFFVETSNVSKTVYLDLKAAVMSRTNDWPRWLPQENADQLLPKWISDRLNGVPAKVVDFLVKVSGFFNLKAIFELIKK